MKNKRLTDFEETKEAVINNYIREDLRELKTNDKKGNKKIYYYEGIK